MTHLPRRDEAELAGLLSEVNRQRIQVRGLRSAPQTTTSRIELANRYDELADALEAYGDAASESGVPLPYRFRDEVRLCRSMGQQAGYPGWVRGR